MATLVTAGLAAPARAAVTPVAKVNFQPAWVTAPAGYTPDTGLPYDAARGSGWVRQDSLPGTRVPLDLTRNTRNRARAGIDARLNTLIHLQYGDVGGSNGVLTAGAYEFAVPAGSYQVTVSAGDQPAYDSSHTVRVEGTTAISGFVSTAAAEYRQATGDRAGDRRPAHRGRDRRHQHQAELPGDRPGHRDRPGRADRNTGDRQIALAWIADASAAGYRIYRGGTLTATPAGPSYLDIAVTNGTAYGYAVSAVDAAGSESPRSAVVTATPAAFALKVNFSDAATAPPAGYVRDSGDAYAVTRGYGWVRLSDGTPVSLVGNGRNRNPAAGQPDVLARDADARAAAEHPGGQGGGRGAGRALHGDRGGR